MKTIHRILTPIFTLLIFPASIFLPFFRMVISSGFSSGETKSNLLDNFGLGEFISLKDLYVNFMSSSDNGTMNLFKTIWSSLKDEKKAEMLESLPDLHWGVIFLVLFAIVLVIALALIIVSALTKKPAVSLILSIAGAVSTFGMNAAFDTFAKPFVNGGFNLNSLIGTSNQLLGAILGNVATIDYMKLGIAYSAILLIFVCTAILAVCAVMEQKNEDK